MAPTYGGNSASGTLLVRLGHVAPTSGPIAHLGKDNELGMRMAIDELNARGIMIGGQRIQVGLPHAGKTAEVTVQADTYQITIEDGIALTAPRTTSRDIKRHEASNYQ